MPTPAVPRRLVALALVVLPALSSACSGTGGSGSSSAGDSAWIEPGRTYRGTVTGIDSIGSSKRATFRFKGNQGERVTFRIKSVEGNYGRSVDVTVPGEQFGPEVEAVTEDAGGWATTVASLVLPETREYALSFSNVEGRTPRWTWQLDFLGKSAKPIDLQEGKPQAGELTASDVADQHGERGDLYRFHQPPGDLRKVRIVVKSTAFEPNLRVGRKAEGKPRDLAHFLDKGAEYTGVAYEDLWLEVRSQDKDKLGPYTLTVTDARTEEMAAMPVLQAGVPVEGRFAPDGPFMAHYKVRGTPGAKYMVEASSSDFDILLFVHNNQPVTRSREARDDNSGGGTNARLVLEWPDAEEWVVSVFGKGERSPGAYRVSFRPAP